MPIDPYYGFYGGSSTGKSSSTTSGSGAGVTGGSSSSPTSTPTPTPQQLVELQKKAQQQAAPGETVTIHSGNGSVTIETVGKEALTFQGLDLSQDQQRQYALLVQRQMKEGTYDTPTAERERTTTLFGNINYTPAPLETLKYTPMPSPNYTPVPAGTVAQNYSPVPRETIEAYNANVARRNEFEQARYNAESNVRVMQMLEADRRRQEAQSFGLGLGYQVEMFRQAGENPANPAFARFGVGAVAGAAGTVDLAVEAFKNPVRAGTSFVEGIVGLPGQFVADPFYTTGTLFGSGLVFKGFSKGFRAVRGEAPVPDIVKAQVPTEVVLTRKAVISAGEDAFVRSEKTLGFVKTEQFVIPKEAEVRPFAEGPFRRTVEVTQLQETKTALGGNIRTVESAGTATVSQGEAPRVAPEAPLSDLLGLRETAKGSLKPETIAFEKAKPTILGGSEVVPYGTKPLSTEAAAMRGIEDITVNLYPKESATASEISIPKILETSKGRGIIPSEGLRSAGIMFDEKTTIDIRPKITQEAPKIYSPNYFSREAGFDFGQAPKRLYGVGLPGGPKAIEPVGPFRLPGDNPFARRALPGETLISKGTPFKRFRPFTPEEPKGGTQQGVGGGLASTGGGAGQIVQQIYRRQSKQIPLADVKPKTVISVAPSAATTVEKILEKQAAFLSRRRRGGAETIEYETVAYPKADERRMPQFIEVRYNKQIPTTSQPMTLSDRTRLRPLVTPVYRFITETKTKFYPNSVAVSPMMKFVEMDRQREKFVPTTAITQKTMQDVATKQLTKQITRTRDADVQEYKFVQRPKIATATISLPRGGELPPKTPEFPGRQILNVKKFEVDFGDFEEGFDVFVRKGGQFVKVSNIPLTKIAAVGLGKRITDVTTAASFKIKPAGAPAARGGGSNVAPSLDRYYKKSEGGESVFIEKSKYRISVPQEYEELYAAKRLKRGLL